LLERNLRAGEQAHRYVWFSHRGKTARDRVVELRRYEFVSDLCGSGRHMVQTVVAHRRKLPAWDSRDWLSFSEKRLKRQWQSCVGRCHLESEKILRDLLSCGWRRLMFRTAGEDIPVPPLKNQKQLSCLGGQQ